MGVSNITQQVAPVLFVSEIADDVYVRKNFENLQNYFMGNNQLVGFNFFSLTFTAAATNFKVAHGLKFIPQDIIITASTGSGTVQFNRGLFDAQNLNLTVTGACRIRFFAGTYWNNTSAFTPAASDVQQQSSLVGTNATPLTPPTVAGSTSTTTTTTTPTFTAQTANNFFAGPVSGVAAVPAFRPFANADFIPPTISVSSSPIGTTGGFGTLATGYLFQVTGWTGSIAVGDTYTNNGNVYACQLAQVNGASGQTLWMSGTNAPSTGAGQTLTKLSPGSGPATITFNGTLSDTGTRQTFLYTVPTKNGRAPLWLEVEMVGGGGGGGPGGVTNTSPGSAGAPTALGVGLQGALCNGGSGGGNGGEGSAGGTALFTNSTTAIVNLAVGGGGGSGSTYAVLSTTNGVGGNGGVTMFGGGGIGGFSGNPGNSGPSGSGGGGGGGGADSTATSLTGAGGGGGGGMKLTILNPVGGSTIPYVVGPGGSGGSGTNAGGAGNAGSLIIREHYQ